MFWEPEYTISYPWLHKQLRNIGRFTCRFFKFSCESVLTLQMLHMRIIIELPDSDLGLSVRAHPFINVFESFHVKTSFRELTLRLPGGGGGGCHPQQRFRVFS